MSMGGEIMEDLYDSLIQSFLSKLEIRGYYSGIEYILLQEIITLYKEHFKDRGIYS